VAKLLIEDPDGGTQVPFLRGILTRSLQNSGLPFDDAYQLATTVRQELDDATSITLDELRSKVVSLLEKNSTPEVVSRYQQQGNADTNIEVKNLDGRMTPFSADQHRHCLETIGLTYGEAMLVTEEIRKHLIDSQMTTVSSQEISRLTYRFLEKTEKLGPAVAKRWLVWIDFLRSGRPLILLVGGTSGCGKSTIATALANQLDIVRTQSTDMLREVMRSMLSKRLLPILHASSFSAWQALPSHEGRPLEDHDEVLLAEGFLAQADLLSVASEAVIERALRERVSLIFEGVHIHPSLLDRIPTDTDAVIAPIMLAVLKRGGLKERISGRGTKVPQRRSKRYLDNFEDIWNLQSFLLSEADRTKIPIIVNNKRDAVIREIMRTVIETLSKEFNATPEEVFG
jgi:2-phosphoglycerate kinase